MKLMNALVLPLAAIALLAAGAVSRSAVKPEPQLSHVVFFTMKDRSPESRAKCVASCQKYLDGHEGAISFSVGTIAEDVKEPVSDRDFDVSIHLVFENKDANARYQVHPRHKAFVAENKDSWSKVRVFDSYLAAK